MFQTITNIGLVAGIFWLNSRELSRRKITLGYGVLTTLLVIMVVSFVLIFSSLWKFSQGGWTNAVLGVNFSYASFIIIHNIFYRERIMKCFQEFHKLKEHFFEGSDHKIDKDYQKFENTQKKQEERIDKFIKFQFWFNFCLSPLNTMVKILTWTKLVEFNNTNYLIYAIYFDPRGSAMFWPTVSLQTVSLHVLCVLQTASDLYLLKALFLTVMSFKYLRIKLGKIISLKENSVNVSTNTASTYRQLILTGMYHNYKNSSKCVHERVKEWIKQHTYMLTLYGDFLRLYTPVLIAYFNNVLLGDCLGIFGVTQDEGNFFSFPEKIIIGSYFVQNAATFTLICLAGTQLAYESTNVFEDGFHADWYDCDPATKSTLGVVTTVAKRPLKLTPRGSVTAELSTNTLLWVLKTMVSVYVALAQIKENFQTDLNVQP